MAIPCEKRHVILYDVCRSLRPVHQFFCSARPFTQPQVLCFTVLFNRTNSPKISIPNPVAPHYSHVICLRVPWTQPDSPFQIASRSIQSFSHSSWQRVPIYTSIKTTRLSVTEAVSVTGWSCTESRPELETVNR